MQAILERLYRNGVLTPELLAMSSIVNVVSRTAYSLMRASLDMESHIIYQSIRDPPSWLDVLIATIRYVDRVVCCCFYDAGGCRMRNGREA